MHAYYNTRAARRLAAAAAVGVGLIGSQLYADTFTYNRTTSNTLATADQWSAGTNWSPTVPTSGISTILTLSGSLSAATAIFSNNDLGAFQLNQLNALYDAAAASTVSITGGTLQFVSNGAATPQLTLNAASSTKPALVIASAVSISNDLAVSNAGALTFSGLIHGSGALTKTGVGSLTLTAVTGGGSTYSGSLTVREGTVALNYTGQTASYADILGPTSSLVMGNIHPATISTLNLTGRNGGTQTQSQTFAGTTFNAGRSAINVNRGSATNTLTLNLGAITHGVGSIVAFNVNGATASISTSTANVNGILGGWASFGSSAFATNTGTTLAAYTGYTSATTTIADVAASNVQVDSTSTGQVVLAAGTTNINTLSIPDVLSREVVIGAGNTLRLGPTGAIWRNVASANEAAFTITGGELTAGGAANTAGELILRADGSVSTTTGTKTQIFNFINSTVTDNGSGVVSLVKTGQQGIVLGNANSYTGNTYILQGTLVANDASGFGTGDLYVADGAQAYANVNGTINNDFFIIGQGPSVAVSTTNTNFGSLRLGGTTTIGASSLITLNGNANISNGTNGTVAEIAGRITGGFGVSFNTQGYAGTQIRLSNTGNDYTGNTSIVAQGTSGSTGSILVLGNSEVIPDGVGKGNVIISAPSSTNPAASLIVNGMTETINGLVSSGSGTLDSKRVISNNAATEATLIVGGANQGGSFFGLIQNGSTGKFNLTKIGSGTQVLTGRGTYSGTTRVVGGVLEQDYRVIAATATGENLAATSSLDLAGGTFRLTGRAASAGASDTITYANQSTLTVSSGAIASSLVVGQTITAPGFGAGVYIKQIVGNVLTLSAASTGHTSAAESVTFNAAASGATQTFAKLTVSGTGTLDLGANDGVVVTFNAVEHTDGAVLVVDNWDGTLDTGGGLDRILITGTTTDFTNLFDQNEVSFVGYSAGYQAVSYGSYYEIVPGVVPEPGALSVVTLGVGVLLRRRRRH